MKRGLRWGGLCTLLFILGCRGVRPEEIGLNKYFHFKRCLKVKAGKDVEIILKREHLKGEYHVILIYSEGLFGKQKRVRMEEENSVYRAVIPGGSRKKGDVVFFWFEVFSKDKLIGRVPDNRALARLLAEGKISWKEMIGRVDYW